MTKDQAFKRILQFLETSNNIWMCKDTDRYTLADEYWEKGIKLYKEYFPDKKMLTQIQDIDTMLP
jgi:hypothetical protein